jgi:phosphohistidine phosphatase SixA
MLVTIWRHGEAGAAASDRERQLTPRGREDVARGAGLFLRHCEVAGYEVPCVVHHSPWLRTTQTAEILAAHLQRAHLAVLRALQPGSDIHQVDTNLGMLFDEQDGTGHVLLVSHQPLVSRLADYYLGAQGMVPSLPPGGRVTLAMAYPAPGVAELSSWALPPAYEAQR